MTIFRKIVLGSALLLGLSAAQASTLKSGVLTIGSDMTYPPYNYMEGGKPAGFDSEFMALLSHQMGLKEQVVDTRFASLILGIKMNKFDVISSSMFVTPERATQVDFLPYMKTGGALLALKGSTLKLDGPEDLCGKKVSSIKGGAWIARFAEVTKSYCLPKGLGAIDVREFPTTPEATQALLSRAVDTLYDDVAVAKAMVDRTGGRLQISSTSVIYPVVVGLAANKDNKALLTDLTQAFDAVVANGSYGALMKKYNVQMPDAQESSKALVGTL
ncbi:MAG: ABC transporter arginine-binding protein 1 [Candidatus Erwinia impunctatus]|nr:ABC transporter arginine-binding protein 1 [Culicoides impunctatus]